MKIDWVVSIDPKFIQAYQNRGASKHAIGKYREAIACIIHEDLQKSSKPLRKLTYNDWLQKQSVF